MTIHLDHFIVPCRNETAAAKQLAELLGVPWGKAAAGPFTAVYINNGLTLDFTATDEDFPVHHYCFRVTDEDFDAIFARVQAAAIPYRSSVRGPQDMEVGTYGGGRGIYWSEPDAHQWEMLTVSYARQPGAD